MKKAIVDSLTVEFSKTPGRMFHRKMLSECFVVIFSFDCEFRLQCSFLLGIICEFA
jgi:hypothetical protein